MMTNRPDPAERVRQRMKAWIDATKIQQREFAKDLNKSQVWLQKVLSGDNHVRLKDLDLVADALHTSAAELVRDSEERYDYMLSISEVRIIERLRRRPRMLHGIADILGIEDTDLMEPSPIHSRHNIKK